MIQNLNRRSFSAYGRVLDERRSGHGFPEGECWVARREEIAGRDGDYVRCANADVYLDYESGMAVLLVALDAQDAPAAFYLDKPVCVRQGVRYCVLPFDESCAIHICARRDAQMQFCLRGGEVSLTLTPRMAVRGIRTLFYQEKENGFFFKGEAHRQYELTYMDRGSMRSIVAGQEYQLSPGEMMLYGPDQWHSQYAEGEGTVCFLTIAFDMDCDCAEILLNRKIAVDADAAARLKGILQEARRPDELSADFICCELARFLLEMIRRCRRAEQGAPRGDAGAEGGENGVVDQALRYIGENLGSRLTVEDVARRAGVSPAYLSALFRRHLKIRPSDYIRREKLEESKRLIRAGELSFSQIAEQLKFSSACHFSAMFKRFYDMTPTEFARSIAPGEMVHTRERENAE